MEKCVNCQMPLERDEDRCSCNGDLCFHCCECGDGCGCGCADK